MHDQDSNNLLELVKPKLQGTEVELANILRWEDDGGKIVEINHSTLDRKRKKPNE